LLSRASFTVNATERHYGARVEFVKQLRTRLLATEVMIKLKAGLPGFDFEAANIIAKQVIEAIEDGKLGYAIVVAAKMP
jgi:hypothetical protein